MADLNATLQSKIYVIAAPFSSRVQAAETSYFRFGL
jgi:hypothetical protein